MTLRPSLTRRRFLGRGAGLALAAPALARAVPSLAQQPARLPKCLSMFGPAVLRDEGHPNDYRLWGNREFVRASGTAWIKLWVSWDDLQRDFQPRSREEAWFDLNMAPGGEAWLWRLDAQIRAARDDGVRVILAVYHAYPTWANGGAGGDPDSDRPATQRMPRELGPDSPWGWFTGYLCARYGGGFNPVGPHEPYPGEDVRGYDARRGNPLGARIDALEITNEPNVLLWPQRGLHERVATMVRTAAALSAEQRGPMILAPSTLDSPDPGEGPSAAVRTDWRTFTVGVLEALRGFRPPVPVGWAHHAYRDVARGTPTDDSRARQVLTLLRRAGPPGPARGVWLTEGGVNLAADGDVRDAERRQATLLRESFRAMARLDGVRLWTQHAIHDVGDNPFKSGLRDDFRAGATPGPGRARPALEAYAELPGSRGP